MPKKTWSAVQGVMRRLPLDVIKKNNLFNLNRAVKEILNDSKVAFNDPCEDCPVELSPFPTRFSSGEIQYWNGTAWVTTGFVVPTASVTTTQITSNTTAVTANGTKGVITTVPLTLAADTSFTFVLNNSAITATSVILLNSRNTGTGVVNLGLATVPVAGSVTIRVTNVGTVALNSAVGIHFNIL